MAHKFTRTAIRLGHKYSTEYCDHCGIESHRYKSGTRGYVVNGLVVSTPPECTKIIIDDAHARHSQPVPVESIMEDGMVIIKLLYDDMLPAFGTGPKSMQMARRFLESKGMEI